jgi:hypothetical protein
MIIENRVTYLRQRIRGILKSESKNKIVQAIKNDKTKFHQFTLDRFIFEDDVKISTITKIDDYITKLDSAPSNEGA